MQRSDTSYINKFSSATRKWVGSKRFSIYVYCILISTFIWFLMKFSGSFTSQMPVQIHYVAPSSDWYVMNAESEIMVDVSGFGFSLMWYKISGRSEIEIDLSKFEMKGTDTESFVVIPTEYLISETSQLFKEDESIDGLYPNILKVDMSHALKKSVPIHSRVFLSPKKGFKLVGSNHLNPSNVVLSGPAHILSNITQINTYIDTLVELDEDKVITVKLDADSLKEWMDVINTAELKIDVDELTSGSVDILVKVKSDDPSLNVKVLPTRVTVFYQVGLKEYELVNEDIIKAYVSVPSGGSLPEKLKVKISDVPDFVEVTRVSPPFVEYLISKSE